jgi:hypothetical protein
MKRPVVPIVVTGVASLWLAGGVATAAVPPTDVVTTTALLKTDEVMAVTIPFKFIVDQKTMPAGRYDLGPTGDDGDRLAILGTGDQGVLVAPDHEQLVDPPNAKPKVVFDQIGGRYYLVTARFPGIDGFTLRVAGAM